MTHRQEAMSICQRIAEYFGDDNRTMLAMSIADNPNMTIENLLNDIDHVPMVVYWATIADETLAIKLADLV